MYMVHGVVRSSSDTACLKACMSGYELCSLLTSPDSWHPSLRILLLCSSEVRQVSRASSWCSFSMSNSITAEGVAICRENSLLKTLVQP